MDEKEIVKKLQLLQNIRPQKNWAKKTRKEILGEDDRWPVSFYFKEIVRQPAFVFAPILAFLIFVAFLGLSHLPLSRDFDSTVVEIAKNDFAKNDFYDYNYYLEKATENLAKAETFENKEKIVKETKEALNKAVTKLPKRPKSPKETENLVKKVKEIENKLATLGAEGKEIQEATDKLKEKTRQMIETEIYRIQVETALAMLENRSLRDEEKLLLEEAKKDYNNQNYLSALEKILKITNSD
ncbi:MAG: hypothetical protein LR000_02430 [Candidatus Pacebacteria bacterium]|nr:hypothetical protein [Candidatus Paceibacterota bacterium]